MAACSWSTSSAGRCTGPAKHSRESQLGRCQCLSPGLPLMRGTSALCYSWTVSKTDTCVPCILPRLRESKAAQLPGDLQFRQILVDPPDNAIARKRSSRRAIKWRNREVSQELSAASSAQELNKRLRRDVGVVLGLFPNTTCSLTFKTSKPLRPKLHRSKHPLDIP